MLKIKDSVDLKDNLQKLVDDLSLTLEYAEHEDSSRYDKIYATCIKTIIKNMKKLDILEKVEE